MAVESIMYMYMSTISRMDYLRTLELDPRYLPARVNLAFLLQVEGKFQEAWNQLTSVLKTDEGHISAREARAVISLQMGNLFGALLDINTAIQVTIIIVSCVVTVRGGS